MAAKHTFGFLMMELEIMGKDRFLTYLQDNKYEPEKIEEIRRMATEHKAGRQVDYEKVF